MDKHSANTHGKPMWSLHDGRMLERCQNSDQYRAKPHTIANVGLALDICLIRSIHLELEVTVNFTHSELKIYAIIFEILIPGHLINV